MAESGSIHAMSVGWVQLARALHAVPLFGVGFGDLLRPARDQPCCISTAPVPLGKDLLAVYGADLNVILRRGGSQRHPWRLVDDIHWHSPDGVAFESCKCENRTAHGDDRKGGRGSQGEHHVGPSGQHGKRGLEGLFVFRPSQAKGPRGPSPFDRVQVIVPTAFPRLYSRGLRSPARLAPRGAVIFGHSWKFPLRWSLTKDIPPEGEPDPPSVDDVSGLMYDSGIGTSDSQSGGQASLYGLGENPQLSSGDSGVSPGGSGTDTGETTDGTNAETSVTIEPTEPPRGYSRKRSIGLSDAGRSESARKLRRMGKRIETGGDRDAGGELARIEPFPGLP